MKQQQTIIKKVVKKAEGGHHGGQWKVAYADFVTALMALFMLLWLISMIAPEKRAVVAHYFKHFTIFEKSGESFMEKSEQILETGEATKKVLTDPYEVESEMTAREFEEALKKNIEEKLAEAKDQVIIDFVEGGVRIQIVDKEGRPMFALGSTRLTPEAVHVLKVISESVRNLSNPIALEGHTDALAYSGTSYSNWELSTERALSARKQLEVFGISPKRITKVAGYAETVPLIQENPKDPRNRRISIIVSFEGRHGEDRAVIPELMRPPRGPEKK